MKKYKNPEIEIINVSDSEVITASDPTLGTETTPVESGSGSWETI